MFAHSLVPVDGSAHAKQALPAALELASRFESEITLYRVVVPADAMLGLQRGYAAAFVELAALARILRDEAQRYLENLRAALARDGVHVDAHLVEDAQVAEAILGAAHRLQADTIVLTAHGHGGARRWILGSITDQVVRQALVPVLLIHPIADGA